jgi:formate hydrogenlyase subunit 3/multisubunit Na+/H+ antiporter MnhD subunit
VVSAGIITMIYMTRTWQLIFQQPPDGELKRKPYGDQPFAPALLMTLCALLGLFGAPLLEVAGQTVAQLGEPALYIQAVLGG